MVKPLGSFNPLWANVHYWVEMASMARAHPALRDKIAPCSRRPSGAPPISAASSSCPSRIATARRWWPRATARAIASYFVAFVVVVAAAAWFIYAAGVTRAPPLVIGGGAVLAGVVSFGWHLLATAVARDDRVLEPGRHGT